MAGGNDHHSKAKPRNYIITGIMTAIPLWVTWLIIKFLFGILSEIGGPAIQGIARGLHPHWPQGADILLTPIVQGLLAIIVIVAFLYFLGWMTTRVLGKKLIEWFDAIMERIPMIKTIYGSVKKLITTFQQEPDKTQRVVLINYPSSDMKTIGLVTREMVDSDTGRHLAAVYVPTTPNPTSGYLEIVPIENITATQMTVDEAMSFIVSGGTVGPDKINYFKSSVVPPTASD